MRSQEFDTLAKALDLYDDLREKGFIAKVYQEATPRQAAGGMEIDTFYTVEWEKVDVIVEEHYDRGRAEA